MRFLLVLLAFKAVAGLRQPYEYLQAMQDFQHGFLNPAEIVNAGIDSPAFADDIVGRVDVTTTFEGIELNTEYIYALWLGITNDNTSTPLIGSAANQTIQTLVIQPPVVFVSTITNLYYATMDYILPMQIDLILNFNDDLKITTYDVTFRRWPEAWNYLLPKLGPQLAKEMNMTFSATSNITALVARRAAIDVCDVAMEYCVGSNVQYSSHDQCMQFLTEEVPFGQPWEGGMNTGFCRYIHKNMVAKRPEVHCAHVGPSGGDMCIARDYIEVTTAFPFGSTLVAPNASVDNAGVEHLSPDSFNALAKAELTLVYYTTVAFYPVPVIALFAILYLSARVVEAVLLRRSHEFKRLTFDNQQNVVMYVLNTLYTTVALGLQLPSTATYGGKYTFTAIQCLKCTAVIISVLYVFEMTYRARMRLSLLLHHFFTLFAIFALFVSLENTNHPATIPTGSIWLWQATSEQAIFVGMYMYRLKYRSETVIRVLRAAAIQSFAFKFAFALYLVIFWGIHLARYHTVGTDVFFSVAVCVIGSLLMVTQVYGSLAVWRIAGQLERNKGRALSSEKESPRSSFTETPSLPTPDTSSFMDPTSYRRTGDEELEHPRDGNVDGISRV